MPDAIETINLSKKYSLDSNNNLRDIIAGFLNGRKTETLSFGSKNEYWALRNVNLKVKPGEIVGIIGPNGAGKSTLLKIISRVTSPTSGKIIINGKIASLLEVGTGFHSELTGKENIYLNASILGMNRCEIRKRYDEIVEFSGIEKFINIPVKKYSSGMYARLAFSVAVHINADILIVDEVLAVGDVEFQKKCLSKMNEVSQKARKTVLFVSHNFSAIQDLCHRTILMREGRIIVDGKTSEVLPKYYNGKDNIKVLPLNSRFDRIGNQKLKITEVLLKNENNEVIDFVVPGQNICFWIKYKVNKPDISEVEFAFPIDNMITRTRIANIYSKTINQKIKISGSIGYIKLTINSLPFNVGKYSYNVWLKDHDGIIDMVQNAGNFEVRYGDYYGSGSLPLPEHGAILLNYKMSSE